MEFATTDLRDRLLQQLRQAERADVAVAYFCPDRETLTALWGLPGLRLLVANDFQVNNPDGLESLADAGHWVRAVSPELHGGNLHSKVYVVHRRDNSTWAMVGSANLTRPGLTTNQEACVVLDSRQPADRATLDDIRTWMEDLLGQEFQPINFELARAVFTTRNRRHGGGDGAATVASRYWALKPGYCGEYWQDVLAEGVISIGWASLPDISGMTREEAVAVYRAEYRDHAPGAAVANVNQIMRFIHSMGSGDLVLLCGRIDSVGTEDKPAHIYGVARTRDVGGRGFFFDEDSDWHCFKRHATIQRIDQALPRSMLIEALSTGSIVPTIQALDAEGFAALEALLLNELGVVLDV